MFGTGLYQNHTTQCSNMEIRIVSIRRLNWGVMGGWWIPATTSGAEGRQSSLTYQPHQWVAVLNRLNFIRCIFLHVFWHKQESVLPHLPVTFLFPPLSTSPRCLESCLLVVSYVMNWVPSKIQFFPWSPSLNLWIPLSDTPKCPFLLSSYWKVSYEQKK